MNTIRDLRRRQQSEHHTVRGMIRRVTLGLAGALWDLAGYDDDEPETFAGVERFQHVGFSSRPRGGAEVIVVHVGGESGHPVAIASRDASLDVDLAEDETAIWTGNAVIKINKDGVIEIGSRGAVLTTLDELVHGQGFDPFTGLQYRALGNTTSKVRAEK
jgi:phage gp45-like